LQKKDKKWAEESGERRHRRRAEGRKAERKQSKEGKKNVFSIQEQYVQRL